MDSKTFKITCKNLEHYSYKILEQTDQDMKKFYALLTNKLINKNCKHSIDITIFFCHAGNDAKR